MSAVAARISGVLPTISFDAICIALAAFVPALSHMSALPLYYIEPIRILALSACLLTAQPNALILAAIMSVVSAGLTGHPIWVKALIISAEMMLNVWLLNFQIQKKIQPWIAAAIAVLASKIFYYGIKFLILDFGFMEGRLVSTPLGVQFLAGIFSVALVSVMSTRLAAKGRPNGLRAG